METRPLANDLNDLRYTIGRVKQALLGLHILVIGGRQEKSTEIQPVAEPNTTKELVRQMLTEAQTVEELVNTFYREIQPDSPTGAASTIGGPR